MKNPSWTTDRRSRVQGLSGNASSRPHKFLSRVVREGIDAFREAGRSFGRLFAGNSLHLDVSSAFLILLFPKRRPIPAPIAIDAASATFRRSRVIHRR
ncbi:hypothetical protein VT85_06670 [Planctomyces sp. SH-PL62]|nr:hypothetical protein VT85_06670 [Planctomyces sp. SH-PL62]